jgi:hypothetical protein
MQMRVGVVLMLFHTFTSQGWHVGSGTALVCAQAQGKSEQQWRLSYKQYISNALSQAVW